jgi:ABC-type transport system involved in multi-copper enzyme maturation permease subunit
MTVLPVIVRELRSQARQPLTYWLRVLGAGALLAVFSALVNFSGEFSSAVRSRAVGGGTPFAELGRFLFGHLNAATFLCNCFLAPLLTADCISRERREGTLGLLFLTQLSAIGIVTGKGFVHMLRGLTLFLAMLPVIAIPVLLGGVSGKDCMMALLINAIVLVIGLAAGLVASAYARDWVRAFVIAEILSGSLVLLFMHSHFALFSAVVLPGSVVASGSFIEQLVRLIYFHTNFYLEAVWGTSRRLSWSNLWPLPNATGWFAWTAAFLAAALCFLAVAVILAAWRVRRSWREEPASRKVSELQRSLTRPRFGLRVLRRLLARSLDRNPIGWLQQYSWGGRITKWGWLGVIMAFESLLLPEVWDFAQRQIWVVFLFLVGVAFSASASFRRERESGALELLLVCPLSVAQVITGRLRGIWMQFLPSGALLTMCLVISAQIERYTSEAPMVWAVMFSALVSLPIIGLYFSLYRIHFLSAWLLTLLFGIIIPFFISASATMLLEVENLVYGLVLAEFTLAVLFWRLLYHRLESRRFAFAHV